MCMWIGGVAMCPFRDLGKIFLGNISGNISCLRFGFGWVVGQNMFFPEVSHVLGISDI